MEYIHGVYITGSSTPPKVLYSSGENMRLCVSVTVQVHENKSMLAFCDDSVRCTGFVSLMDLIVYDYSVL